MYYLVTGKALKLWIFSISIILLFSFLTCTHQKSEDEISEEIVLKIGPVEITKYEFERNKKRSYNPKQGNYQQWLNNYIDEAYILADGYEKKYDTLSTINKTVNYATYTMISQVNGYLWEKTEQPKLNFPDSEIKKIYKKQNKVFHIEFLKFPDKKTMTGLLGNDTIITTRANFTRLVNKCQPNTSVRFVTVELLYPFHELEPYKNLLFKMEQDDITKPLYTDNGIFIVHLIGTESRNPKPFKIEKDRIRMSLKLDKERQIVDHKQKEIFGKANIFINNKVEGIAMEIIKMINKRLLYNKTEDVNDTLLVYTLNNQKKYLLIKDFIDYYKNNPFMFLIEDIQSLHNILENYVIEQYLYVEAEGLDIIHEKKFLLDRKNFKNKLIVYRYNEEEFSNAVSVSEQEMHEYYQEKITQSHK